jgi:LysM repeat protein
VDPARRRELKRFGVPAAFLAAATIAVLLIKAGLNNDSEPAAVVTTATTAATTTQPTTTLVLTSTGSSASQPAGGQYYTIESGDTLGSIAEKYDTTVEALLTLNPDVDPNALQPGDRIRVG